MKFLKFLWNNAEQVMWTLTKLCIVWFAGVFLIHMFIQDVPHFQKHILASAMMMFVFVMFAIAFNIDDTGLETE